MRGVWLAFAVFFLLGCQRTVFGVPEAQWHQLTPEQQAEVIHGYNERERIAKQNEPLVNALKTTRFLLSSPPD